MTLSELKTALEGVNSNAFKDKVAYRAFPVGAAPALPFICFMETDTENFLADSIVYHRIQNVDIELYSENKDTAIEAAIESMFAQNLLVWEKTAENYIDSEDMLQVVYQITI